MDDIRPQVEEENGAALSLQSLEASQFVDIKEGELRARLDVAQKAVEALRQNHDPNEADIKTCNKAIEKLEKKLLAKRKCLITLKVKSQIQRDLFQQANDAAQQALSVVKLELKAQEIYTSMKLFENRKCTEYQEMMQGNICTSVNAASIESSKKIYRGMNQDKENLCRLLGPGEEYDQARVILERIGIVYTNLIATLDAMAQLLN